MNNTYEHGILTTVLYDFRKNRSTQMALLDQKEFILNNYEKAVLGFFADFSKAFGYLSRTILFVKLELYCFRGLALARLTSYLGNCKQYTNINGSHSDIKLIFSGVPQDSILGPFLFNIYINDLVNINKSDKYVIRADNTRICFSSGKL